MDARREPDVIRFHLSENWKMFLNGGFVVALDTERALCVNSSLYKRAWCRLLTASRKADFRGLVCLDRRQGELLVEGLGA